MKDITLEFSGIEGVTVTTSVPDNKNRFKAAEELSKRLKKQTCKCKECGCGR